MAFGGFYVVLPLAHMLELRDELRDLRSIILHTSTRDGTGNRRGCGGYVS